MKKALSLLLSLCLLVGALPVFASAETEKFTIENGQLIMYEGPGGDVVIPDGVTHISNDAFSRAFMTQADLRTVAIPSSVQIIDTGELSGFDNLTKIIVDPNNTAYADEDGVLFTKDMKTLVQFPGGKESVNYYIPSSVAQIGEEAFAYSKKLRGVVIPGGVTEIGANVFYGCSNLTSVTIPNSVLTLFDDAFAYCTSLTNITIPSSVNSIGPTPFDHCTKLQSINVALGNKEFIDKDGVLFTADMKELMQYPGGKALDDYIIPDGVTNIRDNAFRGCSSLKCVTIPGSMTIVDDYAFYECSSLNSAVLLNGVKSIGYGSFSNCDKLTNIVLPSSLTIIESRAFMRCSNLKNVYYGGTQEQWNRILIADTSYDNNDYLTSANIHYNSTGPEPTVGNFSDVKASAYYADAVVWAVTSGITSGIGGNRFAPANTCKREQIVTFLYRSKGSPAVSVTGQFTDMPKNEEFQRAISWAVESNITLGDGKGKFNPEKGCTRAEAMTFIWRAAGKPEPQSTATFSDMPANQEFCKAISWAVENGIAHGTGNNKFSPNETCRREHIVTFLYNAKDI